MTSTLDVEVDRIVFSSMLRIDTEHRIGNSGKITFSREQMFFFFLNIKYTYTKRGEEEEIQKIKNKKYSEERIRICAAKRTC